MTSRCSSQTLTPLLLTVKCPSTVSASSLALSHLLPAACNSSDLFASVHPLSLPLQCLPVPLHPSHSALLQRILSSFLTCLRVSSPPLLFSSLRSPLFSFLSGLYPGFQCPPPHGTRAPAAFAAPPPSPPLTGRPLRASSLTSSSRAPVAASKKLVSSPSITVTATTAAVGGSGGA